jgi:hypothetical protein
MLASRRWARGKSGPSRDVGTSCYVSSMRSSRRSRGTAGSLRPRGSSVVAARREPPRDTKRAARRGAHFQPNIGYHRNVGESPSVIGRYALYGGIASGGMATVYFGRLLGCRFFAYRRHQAPAAPFCAHARVRGALCMRVACPVDPRGDRAKEPPSAYGTDLSPELDEIVLRSLAREPTERFPTAQAMASR